MDIEARKLYRREWARDNYDPQKQKMFNDRRGKERHAAWMRAYRATPQGKRITAHISAKGRRTPHGRFMESKSHAAKRGITWGLTEAEFIAARGNGLCVYCNGSLPETSAGLDRKDNSVGYLPENVVPCCYRCNTMKGKEFTYDEMKMVWNKRLTS